MTDQPRMVPRGARALYHGAAQRVEDRDRLEIDRILRRAPGSG
jgi:hypothetical protein